MPQVGGVRRAARGPPKRETWRLEKGGWGASAKTVVSRPSGPMVDLAGLLDDDAGAFGDQVHREQASRRGSLGRGRLGRRVGDGVALGRDGLPLSRQQGVVDLDGADLGGVGAGRRALRRIGPGRRRAGVVRPTWAGVQAARPSAEEGLSVMPCGQGDRGVAEVGLADFFDVLRPAVLGDAEVDGRGRWGCRRRRWWARPRGRVEGNRGRSLRRRRRCPSRRAHGGIPERRGRRSRPTCQAGSLRSGAPIGGEGAGLDPGVGAERPGKSMFAAGCGHAQEGGAA